MEEKFKWNGLFKIFLLLSVYMYRIKLLEGSVVCTHLVSFRGSGQNRMFQVCQIRHSQSWLGLALIWGCIITYFLNEYLISTLSFKTVKLKEHLNY